MESVIWAFRRLWEQGLIYESYQVMPYSWAAEARCSNFATRMENCYRVRQDPAVTVLFTLHPKPGDAGPTKILVWSTTPWTLPCNLALAVGEDIDYGIFTEDGVYYVLGVAARERYARELSRARQVGGGSNDAG
jgi:isoleucyl-tRNA synthetase